MPSCFVAMPWTAPFDAYYKVVARAVVQAGFEAVRADDIDRPRAVRDQIGQGLAEASVCMVDLTGRDVTAMYVLGIAHGVGKPLIVLVQQKSDLPFDLRFADHIVYRPGAAKWEDMFVLQVRSKLAAGTLFS